MKIVTLNANGLRACLKKGLREWVVEHKPDVLCIQETKAQLAKLDPSVYAIDGYTVDYRDAEKAGYSGVAVYSRISSSAITDRLWTQHYVVHEGRILVMAYAGFHLINVYLPSGTTGDLRQAVKWTLLQEFKTYLEQWKAQPCIIVGDLNVAHEKIDLKNWKNNQNKSGFLPYERAWLTELLQDGWVDTLRYLEPEKECYTWWSSRANARANNVGWRIDYQLINASSADAIEHSYVDSTKVLSDHAPYVVEYSYEKLLSQ